jgi:formylglycine-generating enzyme required for sulfatase activity
MMRAAARKHLFAVVRLAAVVVVLGCAGLFLRGRWAEERAATETESLVRRLLDADIAQTPAIVHELAEYRCRTDPRLEKELAEPTAGRDRQLRARLALLPSNSRHLADLRESLLKADANEFPILRDALMPHRADLIAGFWELLGSGSGDPQRRFRAAAALAAYDPSGQRWENVQGWVAGQLVAQQSLGLSRWVDALRPIKERLVPALVALIRAQRTMPGANTAAEIIADYAADQPEILAAALAYAGPDSYAILFARLQKHSTQAVSALRAILDQTSAEGESAPRELPERRANLAIGLLRLGEGERLWPLLKASPNPGVRSVAIDRIPRLGCDPEVLLVRLKTEPDETIRAALWLALVGFDQRALPPGRRDELSPGILEIYHRDSSAGVHAAVYRLLGEWGLRDRARAGERPAGKGDFDRDKRWYVSSAGQTMVRIEGPVTFMMGSPPDEPHHQDIEKRHQAHIASSYDIGMTEVTVGEFRRFLEQRKGRRLAAPHAGLPDLPAETAVSKISWYEAVAYCNWLSEMEGIPRDQWCYEPNGKGLFGEGMKITSQWWQKTGYRLPSEAEWEYACRGGAATSRCYGDDEELLARYAWYGANAGEDRRPVAALLPNDFGLFDMHGNVTEWCQDALQLYNDRRPGGADAAEIVLDSSFRVVRGGSRTTYGWHIRSAKRFSDRPTFTDGGGFRVVRSRP